MFQLVEESRQQRHRACEDGAAKQTRKQREDVPLSHTHTMLARVGASSAAVTTRKPQALLSHIQVHTYTQLIHAPESC